MSEGDMDSEEEDMPVVGGEGFTPEELAQAEQQFTVQLVRQLSLLGMHPRGAQQCTRKAAVLLRFVASTDFV